MGRVDPKVFYKDCLGVGEGLTVLCDSSFMRWYCTKEANHAFRFGYLLDVDYLHLKTTWCVHEEMKSWYKPGGHVKSLSNPDGHKTDGVAVRVATMRGLECVCKHYNEIQDSKSCIEEVLQDPSSNGFFFASRNKNVYESIKKTQATPIITVDKGNLVLLPPTRVEKRLFEHAKQIRIELEEQQKQEEERLIWEEEYVKRYEEKLKLEKDFGPKKNADELVELQQTENAQVFGEEVTEMEVKVGLLKKRKRMGKWPVSKPFFKFLKLA